MPNLLGIEGLDVWAVEDVGERRMQKRGSGDGRDTELLWGVLDQKNVSEDAV